jgi:hypothetical protein
MRKKNFKTSGAKFAFEQLRRVKWLIG